VNREAAPLDGAHRRMGLIGLLKWGASRGSFDELSSIFLLLFNDNVYRREHPNQLVKLAQ